MFPEEPGAPGTDGWAGRPLASGEHRAGRRPGRPWGQASNGRGVTGFQGKSEGRRQTGGLQALRLWGGLGRGADGKLPSVCEAEPVTFKISRQSRFPSITYK